MTFDSQRNSLTTFVDFERVVHMTQAIEDAICNLERELESEIKERVVEYFNESVYECPNTGVLTERVGWISLSFNWPSEAEVEEVSDERMYLEVDLTRLLNEHLDLLKRCRSGRKDMSKLAVYLRTWADKFDDKC